MKKAILIVCVVVVIVVLSPMPVIAGGLPVSPQNLGPSLNSLHVDGSPSISGDGLTIFFFSDRPGGEGFSDLWYTTRSGVSSPFDTPTNMGSVLNSSSRDTSPYVSSDGLALYFTSGRSGGEGDFDLWISTRTSLYNPFGSPINLGSSINTVYRESRPCVSVDGLKLYFTSDRPGGYGDFDIWVASRVNESDAFGNPVNLGPTVNTLYREGGASISADGLTLIFNSDKPGGIGGEDLWLTTRETVILPFDETVNLGSTINSDSTDNAASISTDGMTIFFASDRIGGEGGMDLWTTAIPEPATLSLLALCGLALLRRRHR